MLETSSKFCVNSKDTSLFLFCSKMVKKHRRRKLKRQSGGFLNRYDFAYAGRDTVNQTFKKLNATAPSLIKDLSKELKKITEQRVEQLLTQGKEITPKLIRGAIEDAFQTPFRLRRKFGKKTLAEVKQKNNKKIKKYV